MNLSRLLFNAFTSIRFPGSSRYWDLRYRMGGDSGAGSYGAEADYKTTFLTRCFAENRVESVIDFGCGDGNQLRRLSMPRYCGYDVSSAAVERCRAAYADDMSKEFHTLDRYGGTMADATLSLDVLYHLVEQRIFDAYLDRLFNASRRVVVIYAVDHEEERRVRGRHVRHRRFTPLITERFPAFRLIDAPPRPAHLPNASGRAASFFVFKHGG